MDSLPIKSSFQIRSGRTTCHTLARRPINQVGILCVRVRAGPGLQQVLGDAEPAGQGEEDVHKQYDGRGEISCRWTRMAPSVTALRTKVKEVNIFKNFTVSMTLKFDYLD